MYCYITQERALQRALAKAHAVIDGLREKVREMEEEAGRAAAGIASRDVDCARKDAEIARKDAEIARKDAEIARLRAMLEKEGIEIKRLKASEAYHDNAHAPTSKGTLTMRQMQKEAVEGRRRASTGRRPGRERGHEGTTSKIGPGAPVEDRFCEARRCHVCGGTDLVERTATKQHVDVRIVADERWLRLHDLECAGCGTVLRAPRDGAVDGTSAGGELLAVIGGLHADCHGTAGTIGAFLRNVLGIRMGAPAVHNAINVIGRGIRPRARAIRDAAEMRADPSEADETVMTTAVERGPRRTAARPGREGTGSGWSSGAATSGSTCPGARLASTRARAGPRPCSRRTIRTACAGRRPTTGSPSTTACAASARPTGSTWRATQRTRS